MARTTEVNERGRYNGGREGIVFTKIPRSNKENYSDFLMNFSVRLPLSVTIRLFPSPKRRLTNARRREG